MKVFFVLKHLFLAVGIALLIGAIFIYKSSSDFLLSAVATRGTIIGLVPRKHDDSVSYHPVVSFVTEGGRSVEFTSPRKAMRPPTQLGARSGCCIRRPMQTKQRSKAFLLFGAQPCYWLCWGRCSCLWVLLLCYWLWGTLVKNHGWRNPAVLSRPASSQGDREDFGTSSPLWDHVMRTCARVEIPHALNAPVLDE